MRAERFAVNLPVRYRPVGDATWRRGRTENISYSGVLFRAEDLLQVDTRIELRVVLPVEIVEDRPEVLCQARIVRTVSPTPMDARPGLAVRIEEYRFMRQRWASA